MLTLLHTADWHLGAQLQGWPREAEHRKALRALVALAAERRVDAVIVAGDIFDSLNPSAEAQKLLYDTLKELRAALPAATIVLLAGNHDPAGRIEAPRALFDLVNVAGVGTIARKDGEIDAGVHLLPLRGAGGAIEAHLLAAPYPRAADLPILDGASEGSPVVRSVRALYAELIAAARARIGAAPLVVTGHLHVAGGLESEGAERRILVGGEHAVPSDVFPEDIAYVALGHLHRPQSVGRECVRYSGSLFPLSKTEIDYNHGVTIVAIEGAATTIEHVPLPRPTPCLRIPPRGGLARENVEAALAALGLGPATPADDKPFVHLTVAADGPIVGLDAEIDAIAEKFPIRLASLTVERPPRRETEAPAPAALRLSERQPVELFREAFALTHKSEPTSEHMTLFHAAAAEE
ncbi:exonuclease SbcCD subunit D C-terminal domain-containing protein [Methylosinus sp. Ce-a6]|uniref:exonuclease SbcCD subunit D C-terminal domain-containing protein n=1 Tax=Methylosinus sp. Ce-a6 TaxID=2172005 RepID=UPI001358915F|nr:exonuclease SbcCD subunit D C-terminal domain-containing protein [Methylosinus sp. Ce-a6]